MRSLRAGLRVLRQVGFAVFVAFAPSEVPAWRADPARRPAIVLQVGEPTPRLDR